VGGRTLQIFVNPNNQKCKGNNTCKNEQKRI
jgi:hypothetical protein